MSVYCLAESARERRLELLGIDTSTVRALRTVGVNKMDDLVQLDLNGEQVAQLRQDIGFTENLELLQLQAQARCITLPGGKSNPNSYEVRGLPRYAGQSLLPEHTINGVPLIRVYCSVEYDYAENRIVGLIAHVTKSDRRIDTSFIEVEGRRKPNPEIKEILEIERDENNRPIYEERQVQGQDVIKLQETAWSGDYEQDTQAEKQLIQEFFQQLVAAIARVADTDEAPIHFYFWSRQEITQLIEGCSRADSQLLGHLQELLGCREKLEQLIYSCLDDEVNRRYALGWTGRDLSVVTSLRWYDRSYHWRRRLPSGEEVVLDQVFSLDVFDFKSDLDILANGEWADKSSSISSKHKFEVRLRYFNSLSAAYWRAYWGTLPDPNDPILGSDAKVKNAIRHYQNAKTPGYLEGYLLARTHALRWVEEGITFKNNEIEKPNLAIAALPNFTLGVNNTARAGIDFLRLDQHVKVMDWIANHLIPPIYRVPLGRTIPLSNLVSLGNNRLEATIDLDSYGITLETLQANCTIDQGSFVRVTPGFNDPHRGQTIRQLLFGGSTCVVESINWQTGHVELAVRQTRQNRYQLGGRYYNNAENIFDYATLDESATDFVAGRVDSRLVAQSNHHVCEWFNPVNPQIPLQNSLTSNELEQYCKFLESLALEGNNKLDRKQIEASVQGIGTLIQLLQGPPGTGKTETTAIAIFIRILARLKPGDIILLSAHTHTAVNNLLLRLNKLLPLLIQHATNFGLKVPSISLNRVDVRETETHLFTGQNIELFESKGCRARVNQMRSNSVLVIGGVTNGILKMAEAIGNNFQVSSLIVDEASMMVFPHFLSLATLVSVDGEIMLAGDHRQLAPIITHDWESEDRPPVLLYQPYVSAYQAVQNLKENPHTNISDQAILRSALDFTFRLPPIIRHLIARLYRRDNIELQGLPPASITEQANDIIEGTWEKILQSSSGLFLIVHSERQSRRSNPVEVKIIEQILAAGGQLGRGSVAIVTPHCAQRTLLKTNLKNYYGDIIDVVDTVEKLQGGERPVIFVSATASDPSAISKNVEFILDLNRSNVAFSRVKERLIVVCSESLLNHIPTELENYEDTMLWKALRSICSQLIAIENIDGHTVKIFAPSPEILEAALSNRDGT
ncbi:AAA family ATPase [Aulosira sp. FACHB-615]|nr:AAA family ATPase [Aulosira sp. FACHB-615]